jgi:hypothetical protein
MATRKVKNFALADAVLRSGEGRAVVLSRSALRCDRQEAAARGLAHLVKWLECSQEEWTPSSRLFVSLTEWLLMRGVDGVGDYGVKNVLVVLELLTQDFRGDAHASVQ